MDENNLIQEPIQMELQGFDNPLMNQGQHAGETSLLTLKKEKRKWPIYTNIPMPGEPILA